MKKFSDRPFLLSIFFLILILFFSCGGAKPEIMQIEWRTVMRDDGITRFEELDIYLDIYDPDGKDDLAAISIYPQNTDLVWSQPVKNLKYIKKEGISWLVYPPLRGTGRELPEALYVIKLEDLAGQCTEFTFRPEPPFSDFNSIQWPEASINNGILELTGLYNSAELFLRDEELKSLKSITVKNGSRVDLTSAAYWELWIPLESVSSGFRLGPYPVENR